MKLFLSRLSVIIKTFFLQWFKYGRQRQRATGKKNGPCSTTLAITSTRTLACASTSLLLHHHHHLMTHIHCPSWYTIVGMWVLDLNHPLSQGSVPPPPLLSPLESTMAQSQCNTLPLSYKLCSSHRVIFRGCYGAMETYNLIKI